MFTVNYWKNIVIHCFSCLLLLIIGSYYLSAQERSINNTAQYTITKRLLSVEDGLAAHEVFCGVQDSSGFIWFGTRNGLNRYDGKNCLLLTRQRNKLQDNKVVQLAKDDVNNLFIEYGSTGFQLTTNGKIDVMNATTKEVKTLTAAFPRMPFKEPDVYWISNDGTGDLSFLTAYPFRLWTYNYKKGFKLRYEMKDWPAQNPFTDYRSTGPQCLFRKGHALVKLFDQLTQYFITPDTVIAFTQPDVLRSHPVGFTGQNDLILTYNTKQQIAEFTVALMTTKGKIEPIEDPEKYTLNHIKGRYWYYIASGVNGTACAFYNTNEALYLWNENAFLKVTSPSELKSFENLFLYRLFADDLGNTWVCTSLGVLQLRIEKNRFQQYFTVSQQNIQSNSQARGIYADERGKVVANIWTHTFMQQSNKIQYNWDEDIRYALIKHNSILYCGSFDLYSYDEGKNRMHIYPGGAGSEIWAMISLNDSLLLLGRTNGFSLFNSNSNTFDSLSLHDKNAPEAKFVYRFFKSGNDTVWAVAENGLYTITTNNKVSVHRYASSFIDGLSLLDAYTADDNVFWLATSGEGLYRWNKKNNTIRQFNTTSGFPSDVLYRIEPDEYNDLWISSDYGLIRFDLKTFSVTSYTTADGISQNEFNRTSSFKAKDGRLFFGCMDGINAFYPEDFIKDSNLFNVPLRVIAFSQFISSKDKLVNKTTDLLNRQAITLAPNDKFFTLEFQLLDFAKEEAYRYAYKIEGVDKEWNYINENSIRISGLPHGKFTLHIKAQNHEGAWSKSELSIPLTVLKPFYLQWWFILLSSLLLFLTIYFLIYFRTKQLAADKKKLELTVNERTAQLKHSLSEQEKLLSEKDVLMKEIHHRVKNNLQVISGLLELQSHSLNDETAKDALREGRNRVRSIALIHQNLYQFEDINTVQLKRFVNDLSHQVKTVFQKKNAVHVRISVPDIHLDIDSAVPLGLIMNELLSNSFKYAFNPDKAGEICLSVSVRSEGKYRLLYSDNGPGLPDDFDITKASTLGMQLMADLSRQIGGNMRYMYKNGAVFTINFTNRNVRKNED